MEEEKYTKFGNKFTTLLKETNNIINDVNNFKNRNFTKTDGTIEVDELIVDSLECNNFLYTNKIVFKDELGNDVGEIDSKPVDNERFNKHITNKANPHDASREWFIVPTDNTLDYAHEDFVNMDNTPDSEKCISDAMRTRIDEALKYKETLYYDRIDVMDSSDDRAMLTGKGIYDYAYGDFKKKILNKAFPIGTVYTSNVDTNPSEYFGGTWDKLGVGYILVDAQSGVTGGTTGGNATYTLKASDIPAHNHPVTVSSAGAHTHGRGDMNIYGYYKNGRMGTGAGAYNEGVIHTSQGNWNGAPNSTSGTSPRYKLNAADGWNSSLQSSSNGAHTHTVASVSTTGSESPSSFSLIQPYLATYMWKRIS